MSDAFSERRAKAAAIHAKPTRERGTTHFFRASDETFGEMIRSVGEQKTCFVGSHFTRVIEVTLRQPHEWMPPEQGAGELSEAAPHGIEPSNVRQFVRERRVLLLGRKCLSETLWQDNHWPPDAKREWRDSTRAGQQCDGTADVKCARNSFCSLNDLCICCANGSHSKENSVCLGNCDSQDQERKAHGPDHRRPRSALPPLGWNRNRFDFRNEFSRANVV